MKVRVCNICGNESFAGGPGGRMASTGLPPRCEKCQSLERHRVYRKIFEGMVDEEFKNVSFLQFSNDRTVDPDWFQTHEVSVYGGDNSLDLQNIDRDKGSYDIVMCNHVLEHVADDKSALLELYRIVKDDGFIFLTVPSPLNKPRTMDWGYPRAEQHGHYRIYGADFEQKLRSVLSSAWILSKEGVDDATETTDIVYFICRTELAMKKLDSKLPDSKKINSGSYNG